MTPLVWKLTVDSSEALAQVKQFAAEATALSRAAPPITLRMDASAAVSAQQQAEAAAAKTAAAAERAAERAAVAAEKAAARETAAAEKAARASEAAMDREVNAELRAAERQIAADERRAASAEKTRLREETAAIRAAERAAAANEKARLREEAAATRAAEREAAAAEKAAAREVAAQERKAKAAERATVQLQQMAAVTPKQQALAAYEAEIAAIKRLEIESGNARLAEEARAAAQTRLNQRLATQSGQATASIGAQRAAIGQMGMQLSDVASQLTTGTNPLTILIQQGPQVQQAFNMGGGAANVLKGALADLNPAVVLLGASVIALGTAYFAANRETQRTLDQRQFEHELTLSLIPGIRKLEDAKIKEAVATGVLTESEGALSTARLTAQRAVLDYAEAQKKQKDGINEQIASAEKWLSLQHQLIRAGVALIDVTVMAGNTVSRIAKGETLAHVIESDTTAIDGLMNSVTGLSDTVDDGKAKLQALSDAEIENAKNAKAAAEADAKAAAAKASHAKAAKELQDWLRRLNEAMAEENRQAEQSEKAWTAAEASLQEVARAAGDKGRAELGASEKAVMAMEAEIRKAQKLRDTMLSVGTTNEARETALQEYANTAEAIEAGLQRELTMIRQEAEDKGLKLRLETAKKQKAILEAGARDHKAWADANRKADTEATKSLLESTGRIAQLVLDKESEAATQAITKVNKLHELLQGLSTETVDTATLSGKALVKAYKSGQVAAEDLSAAQRSELEKTLAMQEKAAKKEAKTKKEAALQAWEINQATAIAGATIQGIQAVVNALATVPYPAAPFVAAAAGTAAAVQVAEIASAKPPSFRAGGVISDAAPSAGASLPDVRMIAAELGESINTRRGTQNLGGEEGVRRNNAGMPIQPSVTVLKLRHETLDRVFSELKGRPSSVRSSLARHRSSTNPYIGRG